MEPSSQTRRVASKQAVADLRSRAAQCGTIAAAALDPQFGDEMWKCADALDLWADDLEGVSYWNPRHSRRARIPLKLLEIALTLAPHAARLQQPGKPKPPGNPPVYPEPDDPAPVEEPPPPIQPPLPNNPPPPPIEASHLRGDPCGAGSGYRISTSRTSHQGPCCPPLRVVAET